MIEVRWFWKHWKTWDWVHVTYEDGCGTRVFYIGCLVLVYHYFGDGA